MKRSWLGLMGVVLVLGASIAACGSDSSSGGDGAGAGTGAGTGGTSSMQQCSTASGCVNGSCKCTAGGNKDMACCDDGDTSCSGPPKCGTLCKVCM